MPSFPVVVEDTSPMLNFSPAGWRAGVSGDSQLDQYSQSSYLLTQTDGATISLEFFGSSVQVFGSKRSYHGEYQVQVDANPFTSFNSQSNAEFFNQLLFGSNLTLGFHELRFANLNTTFTDLDYVIFQTSVGHDDETLIVNTFQDGHPYFTYSPPSSWTTPDMVSTFIGSTGHATTAALASVNFTFHGKFCGNYPYAIDPDLIAFVGDTVALYGPVGPNSCSSYSVKVDDGDFSIFSANRQFYRPQQMLFYAGHLGSGKHTLQIQTAGSSMSGEFAIDFATVYTTPSLGGSHIVESNSSFNGIQFQVQGSTPSRTRLEKDLIVAIAIVSSIAILAILGCIYLYCRRHRAPRTKENIPHQKSQAISPFATSPPVNIPSGFEIPEPQANTPSFGKRRGNLELNTGFHVTASSSGIQGTSELRSGVDDLLSPPHYTTWITGINASASG